MRKKMYRCALTVFQGCLDQPLHKAVIERADYC